MNNVCDQNHAFTLLSLPSPFLFGNFLISRTNCHKYDGLVAIYVHHNMYFQIPKNLEFNLRRNFAVYVSGRFAEKLFFNFTNFRFIDEIFRQPTCCLSEIYRFIYKERERERERERDTQRKREMYLI